MGTLLLFNYSDMPAAQVVGTDILFGIVLAATGSILHFRLGSVGSSLLKGLLIGGIPGVLLGCLLAGKVSAIRLRTIITMLTLLLGVQLVWTGANLFGRTPAALGNGRDQRDRASLPVETR